MTPALGSGRVQISQTSQAPVPSEIGAFRTVCTPSHMAFDDPVVFPGRQGATHLHQFFGNTGTNYASTAETIASTGNSTCRGGIANRSAYWTPAIIDIRNGKPIVPELMHVYYKQGYNNIPIETIGFIPNGLRFLAGNSPTTTGPTSNGLVRMQCRTTDSRPDLPPEEFIPACPTGYELWVTLELPNCWDGVNLDSPDHRSHMANSRFFGGLCPASHPHPIPHMAYNIVYPVTSADDTRSWRLSSDAYPADRPGGYSMHGDLIFGWIPEVMQTFINRCVKTRVDCFSHLLGDGREIY